MGFLDWLLKRPLTQDRFAAMIMNRIRASGDNRPVRYESEQFRLYKGDDGILFLGNIYQEYLAASNEDRERIIHGFLTMWHTTSVSLPDSFEDASLDLLPVLRARDYFEVGLRRAGAGEPVPPPPYETVAEHLGLAIAYDLPTSTRTLVDEDLEKWNTSFYEAMEVARQNLQEREFQYAQIGSLYALANGDSYDSTRMMLLDFIRGLSVEGDAIAMVPNRDRLYITGSADPDGLAAMLQLVEEDLQSPRFISGMAYRLAGDEWQLWLPAEDHSLYEQFRLHSVAMLARIYSDQTEILNNRMELTGEGTFSASFSCLKDELTGALRSYCMWAENLEALLPETDEVFFVRPKDNEEGVDIVGRSTWKNVIGYAGHLMEAQGIYPERWRVRAFPSQHILEQITAS